MTEKEQDYRRLAGDGAALGVRDGEDLMAAVTPDTSRLRALISGHREEILRIVAVNRGSNPRVFGSVLHGDAGPDSDIDLLVDAQEEMTLVDLAAMIQALEGLLRIRVQVCTPPSLPARLKGSEVEFQPVRFEGIIWRVNRIKPDEAEDV